MNARPINQRAFATLADMSSQTSSMPHPVHTLLESTRASDNVASMAERICQLNLIETSQLVSLLREKLKLPEVTLPTTAASVTTDVPASAATSATPVVEKAEFTITLQKFDPTSKAKVIREIKILLPTLNLVEAKAFVEAAPKVIKERVKKEEAEKIKQTLEALGATVSLS